MRSDSQFALSDATDQYSVYSTLDGSMEWTISTPQNVAHPVASCRKIFEENGRLQLVRKMRCNDTAERCNAAFVDFKIRDGKLRQPAAAQTP